MLGLHVDDVLMSTLPGLEHLLEGVRTSFEWGGDWHQGECTFVGRRIVQHPDGSITIDQTHYVSEIATTKTNLSPETPLSEHPELVSEFRSGIGSLQWMSGTTRGDISADTSLLQKSPKDLTVGDLQEVNSVLKYVRATKDAFFRIIPIPFEELVIVTYGDSGFADAPGGKSQEGLVVTATDRRAFQRAELPLCWSGVVTATSVCSGQPWRPRRLRWTRPRTMATS